MTRKTAIAFCLSMVAGTGFAAAAGSPTGLDIGADSKMPITVQFDMLDRNDDGFISRTEAQASSEMSALYDSFNTTATIEEKARDKVSPYGITRAQFKAGIQAMGSGAFGPAVSGGGTYIVLEDGTRIKKENWDEYQRSHNTMYHAPAPAGTIQQGY